MSSKGLLWERGEKIGAGGYGTVYKATPIHQNGSLFPSLMAVKSVASSDSSRADALVTEGKILSSLQGSPYIIGCLGTDITLEDNCQFNNILLEYASLGSFWDLISCNPNGLPEPEVRHYTRCLLQGLKHIHEKGYVHCDVKPGNILLLPSTYNGAIPKISDFGLTRRVGESIETCPHKFIGTPQYMAPESLSFFLYEPPCDVWALGCVVLEMLTGQNAWPWEGGIDARIACIEDIPEIPKDGFSIEAQNFIGRCLVKEAKERWTIEMLLEHPFLTSMDEVVVRSCSKVAKRKRGMAATSPMGPFDLVEEVPACPYCLTPSSVPECGHNRDGKRRKL